MNTGRKGDLSESIVVSEILKLGYTPHVPWGDNERHDLAVEIDGEWIKVQVKTLYEGERDGRYRARLCTHNARNNNKKYYSADEVDAFALYCDESEDVYWFWFDEVERSVTVAVDYKQKQKNMNLAEDYEISERLK